jgi:signal transduction histidine kinase
LDQPGVWLATLPATAQQRRRAFAAVAVLFAMVVAVAPFAKMRLPEGDGFIPAVQAVIVVTNLITAALLFTKFSLLRLRALLVLANGYLFNAVIVFVHTLTFPRAFAPQGLLVDSFQTTGWLYLIWHLSFPASVIAYVLLNNSAGAKSPVGGSPRTIIGCSVVGVTVLGFAILWFLIAADRLLPSLFVDRLTYSSPVFYLTALTGMVAIIALVLLLVRKGSVLDQWLTVSVGAMAAQSTMASFFSEGRFDLGWYSFRVLGVVSSTAVLLGLLIETTRLYAKLSIALRTLQAERNNKLLSGQAATAAIAHEIRQPLTAIAATGGAVLAYLNKATPDLPQVREAVKEMIDGCERASEAIEAIRNLFRTTAKAGQPIDVNEIILDVMHAHQEQLTQCGVAIHRELTDSLPHVPGHRAQLQEVVANLVENAIDAMEATIDRDRLLRVKTSLRGGDAIAVEIQDTGLGIDPVRLDRIFDAFVTTKQNGTGLGLAICRMIVEHHGGNLTASSDGASGSRFEIVLPIMAVEGAAGTAP